MMDNEKKPISILEQMMNGAVRELRRLQYSDASIRHRQEVWTRYLKYTSCTDFDYEDWLLFLREKFGIECLDGKLSRYQRSARKAMITLQEYAKEGSIHPWHLTRKNPMAIPEEYQNVIEHFTADMEKRDCANQTKDDYQRMLRRLSNFLKSKGVLSISELSPEYITPFIASVATYHGRSIGSLLSELRQFFRFLYLNEYHLQDLSLFIPKSNILRAREHLPHFWTQEDIQKLLTSVDVGNPIGKRNYAIILLVVRLGLRVSDVKNLCFDNIKWERNCIEIVQHKTKQSLTLPLPDDVGNAIIDYLQNGRPPSDVQNIFVRHCAPFIEFDEFNRLRNMINRYIFKAGIEIHPDKSYGLHSLRHTLATEMLKKEVPLTIIQKVLGHQNVETTANYLRVDVEQLRTCALPLEVPHA